MRAFFILAAMIYGLSAALAMDHGFDPNDPTVQWFESLRIPDDVPPKGGCCGKGDAYAIHILEEAIGDSDDKSDWGTAEIADGSAKEWPDGTTRTPILNGTRFKFPKKKVNPLADGNPTNTAWAFLSVIDGSANGTPNYIHLIYCVIQLPPGS